MNYVKTAVILLAMTTAIELGEGGLSPKYMDSYLPGLAKPIKLGTINTGESSSLVLQASKSKYPKSGYYKVVVSTPVVGSEHYLLVNIPRFNLRRTTQNECIDRIIIKKHLLHGNLHYDGCWSNFTKSFSTGGDKNPNEITVELKVGESTQNLDLEMVFTVAEKCPFSTFRYQFRCDDNYCVNSELKCNGDKNCLDSTDESPRLCQSAITANYYSGGNGTTVSVGVPIGTIIFLVIVGVCVRRYRMNRQRPVVVVRRPETNVPVINIVNANQSSAPAPPPQPYPYPYPPPNQYPPQPNQYAPQPNQYPPQGQFNQAFQTEAPPSYSGNKY